MSPSVYPANNLFPKAFQQREVQTGNLGYFLESSDFLTTGGFKVCSGSALTEIRFQILIPFSVAAAIH